MRVRSRLMLAFGYVLLVVIVALTVPLAVNLRNRSLAEQRAQETTLAVSTAFQAKSLLNQSDALQRQVRAQAIANQARVIVVDAEGTLVADSAGLTLLGTNYATSDRPEIVAALDQGQVSYRVGFSDTLRQEIQAVAAPMTRQRIDPATGRPEIVGAVRVTQSTDQIAASVRRSVVGLIAIGVGVLVAGLLVAFVLAGTVSRPLRRLAGTARTFDAVQPGSDTSDVQGPREIEEVAHSFDDMAARLEATVRAQREFTANASHQLRTPLTGLKLRLESALAETPPEAEDLRRQLEAADREADRLTGIVERLLVLAKRIEEGTAPSVVDLVEAAAGARERFRQKAREAGGSVELSGPNPAALARADRGDVDQMLDALVDNALSYGAGPVRIEAGRADGQAFLAVEDDGPGIPEDEIPRVAERFYRGRDAPPGGTGLGLALVRELAERSGGEMVIARGREHGTRVEVRLPAVNADGSGP